LKALVVTILNQRGTTAFFSDLIEVEFEGFKEKRETILVCDEYTVFFIEGKKVIQF